ncbi:MAG: NAD(P)H-dependent glycerol-3-phosphate dehydrogenase [candidate division KSB1 bacterium]|nr:NAD(P)H-dependent glycerol-3-phosphate dehydrogenase [candidate division KSB1 bacterium]
MNDATQRPLKIAVLGAGSWGMTLADYCAELGHSVVLWEYDAAAAERLQKTRKREELLPGFRLADKVAVTNNLQEALHQAQIILLVVPTHVMRAVLQQVKKHLHYTDREALIVNCAKGIETDTLCRISEVVQQELSEAFAERYVVLSGPSHAEEVFRRIPTAIVAASRKEEPALFIQKQLSSTCLRIYRSTDVVGVELGGALKNVIAIAAGVCDGAGFGDNTKAALQPRGLAEIARLGRKMGAEPLTFAGLSGMGDLIVTCMSRHSRNRYVGEQIGRGRKTAEILAEMTMVAEGVKTAKAAVQLSKKYQVEMPICSQVYALLYEDKDPRQALLDLMTREVKPEIWS